MSRKYPRDAEFPDLPQWTAAVTAAGGQCQCESQTPDGRPYLSGVLLAPCGDHYRRCDQMTGQSDIKFNASVAIVPFVVIPGPAGTLIALCQHCADGWAARARRLAAIEAKSRAAAAPTLF